MVVLVNHSLFFRYLVSLLERRDFCTIIRTDCFLLYRSFPLFYLFYDIWLKRWFFVLYSSPSVQHCVVQDA